MGGFGAEMGQSWKAFGSSEGQPGLGRREAMQACVPLGNSSGSSTVPARCITPCIRLRRS